MLFYDVRQNDCCFVPRAFTSKPMMLRVAKNLRDAMMRAKRERALFIYAMLRKLYAIRSARRR